MIGQVTEAEPASKIQLLCLLFYIHYSLPLSPFYSFFIYQVIFFSISFHLPRLLLTSFGIKPQDKNFRQRHSYRKQLVRCEAPLLCATHLVTACLHYVKYLDETAGNCGIKQSLHCSAHTDTRVATKSTKHSVWWDAVYGLSLESSYFSLQFTVCILSVKENVLVLPCLLLTLGHFLCFSFLYLPYSVLSASYAESFSYWLSNFLYALLLNSQAHQPSSRQTDALHLASLVLQFLRRAIF